MICVGTDTDHCCWAGEAGRCRYLGEHVDGRRWSCTLRAELGSWDAVHDDPRYAVNVRPWMRKGGVTVDCGDWPPTGQVCAACGRGD